MLQPGCSHVKRRGRPLRLDRFLVGARCTLSVFSMANSSMCLPPWAYVVVLLSIEMFLGVPTPPHAVRRGNSAHLGAHWGYVRGREDPEPVQKRVHGRPSTLVESSHLTDSIKWNMSGARLMHLQHLGSFTSVVLRFAITKCPLWQR